MKGELTHFAIRFGYVCHKLGSLGFPGVFLSSERCITYLDCGRLFSFQKKNIVQEAIAVNVKETL